MGLYLTKVAESGVLPTNPLGKPYICTGDDLKTAGDYIKMNIEQILEIDSKNKVKSHIYVIINKINEKAYIGQANTHRLNKKK